MATEILSAGPDEARYQFDRVQRWLHWTMAALILVAIVLGAITSYLPAGHQPRQGLLEVHKSIGFTILALLIVRATWRVMAGEPPYRTPLGRLNHLASRAGHAALYGLMLFMQAAARSWRVDHCRRGGSASCRRGLAPLDQARRSAFADARLRQGHCRAAPSLNERGESLNRPLSQT
jgi:hypothetical protein